MIELVISNIHCRGIGVLGSKLHMVKKKKEIKAERRNRPAYRWGGEYKLDKELTCRRSDRVVIPLFSMCY